MLPLTVVNYQVANQGVDRGRQTIWIERNARWFPTYDPARFVSVRSSLTGMLRLERVPVQVEAVTVL